MAYSKRLVHGAYNFKLKDLHFLPYVAYSKTVYFRNGNVVSLSSFTVTSNPGNDGSSVFSVAYSKHLVHKISD